jgi:hypothetical protein
MESWGWPSGRPRSARATPEAGFAGAELTTFCRLDEVVRDVTGQRLEPDRAVLACRVVEPKTPISGGAPAGLSGRRSRANLSRRRPGCALEARGRVGRVPCALPTDMGCP